VLKTLLGTGELH